jgi:hypothetical protein
MSVILNAPAVFRFTAPANPERHLQAAEALGVDVSRVRADDAGKVLADRITWFMQRLQMPNGLRAIGYSSADIPALVEGTLPQHRVTKLSPRRAGADELAALFEERDGRMVKSRFASGVWNASIGRDGSADPNELIPVRIRRPRQAALAPGLVVLPETRRRCRPSSAAVTSMACRSSLADPVPGSRAARCRIPTAS